MKNYIKIYKSGTVYMELDQDFINKLRSTGVQEFMMGDHKFGPDQFPTLFNKISKLVINYFNAKLNEEKILEEKFEDCHELYDDQDYPFKNHSTDDIPF